MLFFFPCSVSGVFVRAAPLLCAAVIVVTVATVGVAIDTFVIATVPATFFMMLLLLLSTEFLVLLLRQLKCSRHSILIVAVPATLMLLSEVVTEAADVAEVFHSAGGVLASADAR